MYNKKKILHFTIYFFIHEFKIEWNLKEKIERNFLKKEESFK